VIAGILLSPLSLSGLICFRSLLLPHSFLLYIALLANALSLALYIIEFCQIRLTAFCADLTSWSANRFLLLVYSWLSRPTAFLRKRSSPNTALLTFWTQSI
jgi:hypothetical protein